MHTTFAPASRRLVPGVGPAGGEAPTTARPRLPRGVLPVIVLLTVLVLRLFIVELLQIPSGSMAPTLEPGEHVLSLRAGSLVGGWHRGDVVAMTSPADGELLVKRIVGIGGDRVAIRDGRLVVNGHRVAEPYTDPDAIDSVFYGPVRVASGTVLVMGDNRANSVDSRTFGTVPESDIEGRVVAVVWPLDALHLLNSDWSTP
jgi:signal peptidase I